MLNGLGVRAVSHELKILINNISSMESCMRGQCHHGLTSQSAARGEEDRHLADNLLWNPSLFFFAPGKAPEFLAETSSESPKEWNQGS
jgi:hypothetical protein